MVGVNAELERVASRRAMQERRIQALTHHSQDERIKQYRSNAHLPDDLISREMPGEKARGSLATLFS